MQPPAEAQALRRFDRFYRRRLAVLAERLPGAGLSPAEARLLGEIADREGTTASLLARDLMLDPGYVSRILGALEKRRLVLRRRSREDARQSLLALTSDGQRSFARLDARATEAVGALVARLTGAERRALVAALARIEHLLSEDARDSEPYLLRPHRPGDMGWIIRRHAELYQEEVGWDATFEGFVAEIGAAFLKSYDPARDCCWIAERAGEIVGSACLVRVSPDIAKLRFVLVEPGARRLGIGSRLVAECAAFARRAGYAEITLWTNDILDAARRIFQRAGFRPVGEENYRRFGRDLLGQTWQLRLEA